MPAMVMEPTTKRYSKLHVLATVPSWNIFSVSVVLFVTTRRVTFQMWMRHRCDSLNSHINHINNDGQQATTIIEDDVEWGKG
jgi:hypothetical protein